MKKRLFRTGMFVKDVIFANKPLNYAVFYEVIEVTSESGWHGKHQLLKLRRYPMSISKNDKVEHLATGYGEAYIHVPIKEAKEAIKKMRGQILAEDLGIH